MISHTGGQHPKVIFGAAEGVLDGDESAHVVPHRYSAVIPIPPCIWIASWPMSRAERPICNFTREAITGSTTPSARDIVAYRLMLRANSSETYRSAARCVSVWNFARGTPNAYAS